MITLDFNGLHEPKCKGVDKPGTDSSDYELWSPHDDGRHGSANNCFLGQQVTYIRRKQDSECFNGEDMERQTRRVPCQCTDADFECDKDYVKNSASGKCEKVVDSLGRTDHFHGSSKEQECAVGNFYYVTQGYRKIPGDKCYGGPKIEPIRHACSHTAWITSFFSFKQIAFSALIGACLFYGWPIIEAIILILPIPDPKNQLDKVKNLAGSAQEYVSGAVANNSNSGYSGAGYSQNLEDQRPDSFIDPEAGDDSDDDIGKIDDSGKSLGLDYDSDEKDGVDLINAEPSGSNELIDLGGGGDSED